MKPDLNTWGLALSFVAAILVTLTFNLRGFSQVDARFGNLNKRIGDMQRQMDTRLTEMQRQIDTRFNDLRDLLKSEVRRVEERIEHQPISRLIK